MNHQKVSFVKSGLRILAGVILIDMGINYTEILFCIVGGLFVLAEVLGIIEELV